MNKKQLYVVRNKIDKLDQILLNIIKKRTVLVNKVIKIKKFKKQIVDNKRISEILKSIRTQSLKKKIDPTITKKIWLTMIKSYIEYEKKNFNKK
jgi:chorismate mutase|tara:strand:- start:57 stop:338 length:282 start_codon:yes stop_codon:yes gene_type:complete